MMKQLTQTTHLKMVEVLQELKTLQLHLDLENPYILFNKGKLVHHTTTPT